MPETAAILVNYNSGELTFCAIESLLNEPETDIVVIDNASNDGSFERLVDRYASNVDRVKIYQMKENLGFGPACNVGSRKTSADYLFFFNNDAIARPGLVRNLRDVLVANPDIGIVGPVVLDADERHRVQYTGPTIDRWGFTFDPTSGTDFDSLPADPVRRCFYISGCALMIARVDFEVLRGFDEAMFMFCEDVDLCWRMQLLGKRIATVRGAICEHVGGGSAPVGSKDGVYVTSSFRITEREKNTFRMMVVNLGAASLLRYALLHYPLTIVELVVSLMIRRPAIAYAYWRAIHQSVRGVPATLSRRRATQESRIRGDREILRLWSPRYEKIFFLRRTGLPRVS